MAKMKMEETILIVCQVCEDAINPRTLKEATEFIKTHLIPADN